MFSHILKQLKKNQKGFTLIEMTVAVVLVSIVCLGATMANAQIMNQTARNNDFTTASQQALNTVHWISRDVQMSHSINGTAGFPFSDNLTIAWTQWNNTECVVIYSLDNNQLNRSYSENGTLPEVIVVAKYINDNPSMTNCSYADGVLTIKITSTVGENDRVVDFTKEASISSRPQI